jgi:uncharacterized membrane protein YbhN (UPF0104 family)
MIQKNKDRILKLVKTIISVTIVFFIIRYIKANSNTLKNFEFHINYVYLTISFIILLIFILNQFFLWYYITKLNRCNIEFSKSITARAYSELGKYIPGKVFGYAMLLYAYSKANQSKMLVSFGMFFELLASTLATSLIFILSVFFTDVLVFEKYRIVALVLLVLFFILIQPKILNFFSVWFLKIAKREPVKINVTYLQLIKIILLYVINFMIFGVAFVFFIKSIYNISFYNYLYITGTTAVAGLIGLFAIFVPAGLGVREGILVFTLSYIIPPALTGIIALASRLWMTFAEILLFGLIFSFSKLFSRRN